MRLVFDTNVLIAAFATRSASADVLDHCLRNHTIFSSPDILREFENVMHRKFKFEDPAVESAITFLKKNLLIEEPPKITEKICRDPKDNHVLALALRTQADAIITGDSDLLILKEFRGIPTLKPSEFWGFEKGLK